MWTRLGKVVGFVVLSFTVHITTLFGHSSGKLLKGVHKRRDKVPHNSVGFRNSSRDSRL